MQQRKQITSQPNAWRNIPLFDHIFGLPDESHDTKLRFQTAPE